MKRILSLLLCLALCLTLFPAGAALAEGEDLPLEEVTDEELIEILDETEDDEIVIVDEDGSPIEESGTGEAAVGPIGEKGGFGYDCLYIEPLYRNVISEEQLAAKLDSISTFVPADELESEANASHYCASYSAAHAYIRSRMLERETRITFMIPYSVFDPNMTYNEILDGATAYSESCSGREGDALKWGSIGWGAGSNVTTTDENGKCLEIWYELLWTTDKSQENELTTRVNYVMSYLGYSASTERDKIMAIHDYICDNVNYDYEHLSQGADYPLQFSAYAAMCQGTAVCQGYAILFYRLAKEAGLSVRVITSAEHAWNIVRIGSVYYNIDTTWDGQDTETTHDWCLLGMRDFSAYHHIREYPYYTDEFNAAFPMVKDSKSNLSNLSRSFTTVDGGSVTGYASSKPKLLIFGYCLRYSSNTTNEFLKPFLDYDLSGLNVVVVDMFQHSKSEVRTYRDYVAGTNARFCYDTSDGAANAAIDYLNKLGYQDTSVQTPIFVFIDTNNKIQNYRVGAQGPATIAGLVKDSLGVTLGYGAPRIREQPSNHTGTGDEAEFSTFGLGRGTISYQWYFRTSSSGSWNKCSTGGYNTSTYTVKATRSRNGYQYRCAVKNAYGTTYTNIATLTYLEPMAIVKQPVSATVPLGGTAEFSIECTGDNLSYQWFYSDPSKNTSGVITWNACSGDSAKTSTLRVEAKSYRNGYMYKCEIANGMGILSSDVVKLTVIGEKPVITEQPKDARLPVGGMAQFTVTASTATAFQWYYRPDYKSEWSKCTNGTEATLCVEAKTYRDVYQYRCKVSNEAGEVYSEIAFLHLIYPPEIEVQPKDSNALFGANAVFYIQAEYGVNFQWYYRASVFDDWIPCEGYNFYEQSVRSTRENEGFQYYCEVWNEAGRVSSDIATLTIQTYEAPRVAVQPADSKTSAGDKGIFAVRATGGGLSYQWQFRKTADGSWSNCSGGTDMALYVDAQSYRDGYQYRCKVTNEYGTVYSEPASLKILPGVTQQPKDQTAAPGETVSFTVKAAGSGLSYQWQFRKPSDSAWSNSSGATAATITVEAKSYRDGYQYRCRVSNANGTVYSEPATLTVLSKPTITAQPQDVTANEGASASFAIAAEGAASYQWQFRKTADGAWSNCSGGTSATLTVEAKSYRNGYQYRCRVTNAAGTAYSESATLTVLSKPTITAQPQDQTAAAGETVQFTVAAEGAVSYQWQFKKPTDETWSNCSNGTGATLSVEAKAYRNGYQYRCRVTNAAGTTVSDAATLTVS